MNIVGIKDFYPTLLSFENTIKKSGSRNLMLLEMYIQQKGNINWVIRDSLRSSIHTSFGLIKRRYTIKASEAKTIFL